MDYFHLLVTSYFEVHTLVPSKSNLFCMRARSELSS